MSNNHKIYLYLTNFLIGLGLIGYTLWFYRSSLNLGFNTDAFGLIFPIHLSGLWASLAWDGTYHYAPVTVSWLWLQHLFLELNETAYQLVNVVQQGFIAILVFGLAKELTPKRALALLAALLFVSSASYYEVVFWSIVGSYYHVSSFFYLIGLIAFIRFLKTGQKWLYWLFTACVGLSLFSHELTLSLLPVSVVYYLFVYLPPDDRRQFWQSWLNRRVWLNLGKLLLGPTVMVGLFLAAKAVMSLYGQITPGNTQPLSVSIFWLTRSLFAALTFRGDDRFITGQLVNFFGGPWQAWIWLILVIPPVLLLFVLWFNRLERFLLLWLLGQLFMSLLAMGGIAPRHLYLPTICTAILGIELGNRLINLLIAPLEVRETRLKYLKIPILYLLVIFLFIAPAYQDSKEAEQLWQNITTANQSLKATVANAIQSNNAAHKLYLINTTRYLNQNGFSAYSFQTGLPPNMSMNFPGQFDEVRLVHFFLDNNNNNIAHGSHRINLDEINPAILDNNDYLFIIYLPDEYRFVHLTKSYLTKEILDKLGIQETPLVYTPESAPSLKWIPGNSPFLNFTGSLNLALKNLPQGPTWLAFFYLAETGRETEVELNGQIIGTLTGQEGLKPAWRNETFPLPVNHSQTIEINLRSVGTIPTILSRMGLFNPQQIYNAENNQALWWNSDGALSLAPGTSLTLPFKDCSPNTCQFLITYFQQPGRELTIHQNDNQAIQLEVPSSSETNTWVTARVLLPDSKNPVLTFKATGTLPVLIQEVGFR